MGSEKLKMENKNELLCAYSALLLSDGGKDVTADNINAVCAAAGASVPAYYAQLFEKVNEMRPVSEIIKDAAKVVPLLLLVPPLPLLLAALHLLLLLKKRVRRRTMVVWLVVASSMMVVTTTKCN